MGIAGAGESPHVFPWPGCSYLLNTSQVQVTGQTYPLDTADTVVPRAHDNSRGLMKCFNFV